MEMQKISGRKAAEEVDSSDEENQNNESENNSHAASSSSSSSLSESLTDEQILLNEPFWPYGERKPTWKEGLAVLVAAASTSFNIFGSIATRGFGGIFLYASTGVGAVTCPSMAYQEAELTKVGAFRGVVNDIREQLNELIKENNKLTENVDAVEMEVERLQEMEEAVKGVVGQQGKNMDSFMKLLEESKQINKELNDTIKARALQNIIYLVMESDATLDFVLNENEIEILIHRLSLLDEIDIDEKALRKMFKAKNGSVEFIIDMVKHLILDDGDIADAENARQRSLQSSTIQTKSTADYVRRASVRASYIPPGTNFDE